MLKKEIERQFDFMYDYLMPGWVTLWDLERSCIMILNMKALSNKWSLLLSYFSLSVLRSFRWTFSQVSFLPLESDDEYFDAEDGDIQPSKSTKASDVKKAPEAPNEELINLLLKFEVKEVCVFVCP